MNDLAIAPVAAVRKRAYGRSLGDFRIEGATTPNGLLPAEERLLVDVARGRICGVSSLDWKKPEDLEKLKGDEAFRIRAGFLRFLALGGDDTAPVHERGVNIMRAFIDEGFDLDGCQQVSQLYIGNSYFARALVVRDAHLHGLTLSGSRVDSIVGDRVKIGGPVHLHNGFLAEGEVRLSGAEIGGDLNCIGGTFNNGDDLGLFCDRTKVKGTVFLRNGFAVEGEVRFVNAEIGGNLDCIGGVFKNASGAALRCDGVRVKGDVFLSDGFQAEGGVRFLGAEIGGDLSCVRGSFRNAGGVALNGSGATVASHAYLSNSFQAEGEVQLIGTEIGADLVCNGGTFKNAGADALDCTGANIAGHVYLRGGFTADGAVIFSGAHGQNLVDDDVSRNKVGEYELFLDGFTYDRIAGGAPTDAKTRLAWLMRQRKSHLTTDFRPQPFEQLAKVLRDMGHDADARRVSMEKQKLMIPVRVRRATWLAKPFVWLLWQAHRLTSGYGYRPSRLIIALVMLWLAGCWFYQRAAEGGVFAPADGQIRTDKSLVERCDSNWTTCGDPRLPAFRPYVYSFDNLPPAIDLGQRKAWIPLNRSFWLIDKVIWVPGGMVAGFVAMQNFFGYVGALLFGAIVTGLIKKD